MFWIIERYNGPIRHFYFHFILHWVIFLKLFSMGISNPLAKTLFWNSICVNQRAIHHFEYLDNSRLNTTHAISCKISLDILKVMSDQCKCIWNCYFITITEIGLFHAVFIWNRDYRSLVHSFVHKWYFSQVYNDGLVQDCSICSALAMEILQSCTKPSIKCSAIIKWSVFSKMEPQNSSVGTRNGVS